MLDRLAAWFFLAATLTMGVVPAEGLVLCFEPSGVLMLESSTDGSECDGCVGEHSDAPEPIAPPADAGCCPCIDIPVSDLAGESRVPGRLISFCFDAPAAPMMFPCSLPPERSIAQEVRADRGPPRPSALLPFLRTVVLHI